MNALENKADRPPELATKREIAPKTSDEALRLAMKLAIDEGDFDRAAVLLDAAKRTKPRPVTSLEAVRRRDEPK